MNWIAPPTVTTSSSDAWKPSRHSLRTNSSRGVAHVVGEEGERLAGVAQRRDGLRRAVERLVADPDGSRRGRAGRGRSAAEPGERHSRCLSSPPMSRRLGSLAAALLALVLRRGRLRRDSDDSESDATPRRPSRPPGRGDRRAARRSRPRSRRAPGKLDQAQGASSTPAKTYVATVVARAAASSRSTLDAKRAPQTGGVVQVPRRQGLLRRARPSTASSPASSSRAATRRATAPAAPATRSSRSRRSDLAYSKGVVAMAKGGTEPAGASGSQFFVVTGEDAAAAAGLRAARQGHRGPGRRRHDRRRPDDPDEQPTDPVVIGSVKVSGP